MDYITPQVKEYSTVDDLLKNHNRAYSSVFEDNHLSIDDLLDKNFICIVGEPGIGKSRLIEEILHKLPKNSHHCPASSFNPKKLTSAPEYCLIDALDEVDDSLFVSKLKEIIKYQRNNPETNIIFSCRKHYISSYAKHFATINSLTYIEICRLDNQKVNEIISNYCSEVTQESVAKSPKLKELLSIPRYLLFLIEKEDKNGECRNIGDLFEYIIDESISKAIEGRNGMDNLSKKGNEVILIKRTLEKVAFVMEIARRDSISKDELYTVLDGLKGNMAQMLLANFDLLFFENRILKYTDGKLQFNNSEIQEYLAAKELGRQGNIESILYDIAVHKELKHIYPNWFDVIPHISYSSDGATTLISIIKLIIGYESYLENESFESLLRYVDPTVLKMQDKSDLFSFLLNHYLKVPSYICWGSNVYNLFTQCYTSTCAKKLFLSYKSLTSISLQNIQTILDAILEANELDIEIQKYWKEAAHFFMSKDEMEYKMIALGLLGSVKDHQGLISLSKDFKGFNKQIKERYCDVTSRESFCNQEIIDCWLEECFIGNPHAIQAILNLEDIDAMAYAYEKIINAEKLDIFFNPKGSLVVFFDWALPKQFRLIDTESNDKKRLFLTVIAGYVNTHSGHSDKGMHELIKRILLSKDSGETFIKLIQHKWDLEFLLNRFDTELIDGEFIHCVDGLLQLCEFKKWQIDAILQNLTFRIYKDNDKKDSVTGYISRFLETFKRWEKNSEKIKHNTETSKFDIAYQALSDSEVPLYNKYHAAEILSKNIDFLKQRDLQPFVNIVSSFMEDIDLDKESINKTSENSFSITRGLVRLPTFVFALYQLRQTDILIEHRMTIARTLPLACWHTNDKVTTKAAYNDIIGTLNEEEKEELINWWKFRKDDLFNCSTEDVITSISDYGIEMLAYQLEEYIQSYIEHPDIHHLIPAKASLELIAEGHCNWNLDKYRVLFNSLKEEDLNDYRGINEIKLECNAIMIEKYQDREAIQWRCEYLRNHIFKSVEHNSGHFRPVSEKEVEVTSSNPYMFRCFMGITDNPYLNNMMKDLFEFGLSLCKDKDTREYSNYLLRQIYFYFISIGSLSDLKHLRKLIEKSDGNTIPFYISEIMNRSEILFLNQNISSISKALHLYNRCIEETYLEIRNDADLIRYFDRIFLEVQREIQDVGIYSLLQSNDLSEDFIQRELKNTIINVGCKMGLNLRIDREVTLQDNKRTDLLLWYGMCKPIMIELKLLNNKEIQNSDDRKEYKNKFIQYLEATQPCISIFWVFDVHRERSNPEKFKDLKNEYLDLLHTRVVLTDCKCRTKKKTRM